MSIHPPMRSHICLSVFLSESEPTATDFLFGYSANSIFNLGLMLKQELLHSGLLHTWCLTSNTCVTLLGCCTIIVRTNGGRTGGLPPCWTPSPCGIQLDTVIPLQKLWINWNCQWHSRTLRQNEMNGWILHPCIHDGCTRPQAVGHVNKCRCTNKRVVSAIVRNTSFLRQNIFFRDRKVKYHNTWMYKMSPRRTTVVLP